jgi:hypothetical protein
MVEMIWDGKEMITDRINEKLFWSRASWDGDCLIWTETNRLKDGYGRYHGKRAHRIAYALTHGDIPEGMYVLHTCDVRACINPDHLWAGTQQENIVDAVNKKKTYNASKTSCNNGHEYSEENTYYYAPRNNRQCRVCARERRRK